MTATPLASIGIDIGKEVLAAGPYILGQNGRGVSLQLVRSASKTDAAAIM